MDQKVNVRFDGPDWNPERNSLEAMDSGVDIQVDSYDLDYGNFTVDPDHGHGYNYTIAVPAPLMNEDGEECGMIAWRIEPEEGLLDALPELRPHVGKVYGRIIVTAGGSS